MLKIIATTLFSAVLTAVLTSVFWIWFYNFVPASRGRRSRAAAAS